MPKSSNAKRELIIMHLKNNSGCARCGKSCGCKINCHNYDSPRPKKTQEEIKTYYNVIWNWYDNYWKLEAMMFDASITFS